MQCANYAKNAKGRKVGVDIIIRRDTIAIVGSVDGNNTVGFSFIFNQPSDIILSWGNHKHRHLSAYHEITSNDNMRLPLPVSISGQAFLL